MDYNPIKNTVKFITNPRLFLAEKKKREDEKSKDLLIKIPSPDDAEIALELAGLKNLSEKKLLNTENRSLLFEKSLEYIQYIFEQKLYIYYPDVLKLIDLLETRYRSIFKLTQCVDINKPAKQILLLKQEIQADDTNVLKVLLKLPIPYLLNKIIDQLITKYKEIGAVSIAVTVVLGLIQGNAFEEMLYTFILIFSISCFAYLLNTLLEYLKRKQESFIPHILHSLQFFANNDIDIKNIFLIDLLSKSLKLPSELDYDYKLSINMLNVLDRISINELNIYEQKLFAKLLIEIEEKCAVPLGVYTDEQNRFKRIKKEFQEHKTESNESSKGFGKFPLIAFQMIKSILERYDAID